MIKTILLFVPIVLFSASSFGQLLNPVKWSYGSKTLNQTEAVVFMQATIEEGWHIYALRVPDDGPIPTAFSFTSIAGYELIGPPKGPKPQVKYDPTFGVKVGYYQNQVVFQQKIRLQESSPNVKGTVTFMVCNDTQCLPPEDVVFRIPVKS